MAKRNDKGVLTNQEVRVMRAVWDASHPTTVREVLEIVNAGLTDALAYNTIQTILNILVKKGHLRSGPGESRALVYTPERSRTEVTQTMVGDLMERLFDGKVEPLLLHLAERDDLSTDELLSLRRFVEERLEDRS